MTAATRQAAPVRRPVLDGSGVGWLFLPPALLLVAGLGTPLFMTVWVAIRDNGVTGAVTGPVHDQLFVDSLGKTFLLALEVTALTWVVGIVFTLAVGLARPVVGRLLLGVLFLTFWISLLVRTYGWVLTLQPNGALDTLMRDIGITSTGLGLYQTTPGLLPPMVHIMLPYMVLPLYSALTALDPARIRAARSLGGSEWMVLRRVVLPSLRSGSMAGIVLVFILSLGFYVTPAFLGGPTDQLLSIVIGTQFGRLESIGLTAAMGALLLVAVLALYFVADRFFRISDQWDRA